MSDDEDEEAPIVNLSLMLIGTMTINIYEQMVWWRTRSLGEIVAYDKDGEPIYEVYIKWSEWNDSKPGNLWADDGEFSVDE